MDGLDGPRLLRGGLREGGGKAQDGREQQIPQIHGQLQEKVVVEELMVDFRH
jgi:hypothetical protein